MKIKCEHYDRKFIGIDIKYILNHPHFSFKET